MFQPKPQRSPLISKIMQMDKTEIVQIASQMSTREDLLALLNRIKQDEIRELGFDVDKFYPFYDEATFVLL